MYEWFSENPVYLLILSAGIMGVNIGLIGNFLLHMDMWLTDSWMLFFGAADIVLSTAAAILSLRLFQECADIEEEYKECFTAEEVVAVWILYPYLLVWGLRQVVNRVLKTKSTEEGDTR